MLWRANDVLVGVVTGVFSAVFAALFEASIVTARFLSFDDEHGGSIGSKIFIIAIIGGIAGGVVGSFVGAAIKPRSFALHWIRNWKEIEFLR
jgi:branched-subunit amino acid ABC-type transport system permease component